MAKLIYLSGNCKRFLYFILFLVTLGSRAFPVIAQDHIILRGKVVDKRSKETIIGANVLFKNAAAGQTGAVTDIDGLFDLKVASLPATIVVSYIGYRPQEIDIYEVPSETLVIPLIEDLNVLNEIVVIGYGTQKRSDFTGSLSSVSTEALKSIPVSSFDNALQGRAAGVHVTQTSGQPGAAVSIRIRGGNSINGGNEPLYVIDGFPVYNSNDDIDAGAASGASINALSTINLGDIESIDVLKDASATAIYGARGANGVVLISTKQGKIGQNTITYDTYFGTQWLGKRIPLLNARQFAELKNDAVTTVNDQYILTGKPNLIQQLPFSEAELNALNGVNYDWQDAAFREAPTQNHQLSITGGDEKTRYSLSFNYYKQDGIIIHSDFDRLSTRINLDRKISKSLTVGENLTISQIKANESPSDVTNTILAVRPDFPIYEEDGSFTLRQPGESALGNPIATLNLQENLSKTLRVLGNVYAEYEFLSNFKLRLSFGIDQLHNNEFQYLPISLYEGQSVSGGGAQGNKVASTWLNENTLNYNKQFGAHGIDLLAGYTQQQYNSIGHVASQGGFTTDDTGYYNLGAGATNKAASSSYSSWQLASYLGRVNYNYKEKYYATATLRADGSSRFGKNNKWGYFPSGALAWTLSREDFVKNIRQISNLKLRLSAGVTGNQEIGVYQSLSNMTTYKYVLGANQVSVGYAPGRMANDALTWEKTAQYAAAVDLGLFKDRVSLTLDFYLKKTSDLLLNVNIPSTVGLGAISSGYLSTMQNCGVVQNKGVEVTLNTINIRGGKSDGLEWATDLVFSTNQNKILSLGESGDIISDPFIAKVGETVGSFYVLKTDGIFKSTDDIASLPTNKANTLPGFQRYVDVNGDGTISQAGDRVIVGNSQPDFIIGLTNNFSYKIFDLSFLLQGTYGNKLYNQTSAYLNLGTGYTNATTRLLDRWRPDHEDTDVQRAIVDPAVLPSDIHIEDGSYLRLKNLTVGVSVPDRILKHARIKQLRFYVSAQNLITWTKYSGFDPEASKNEQTTLTFGRDNAVYPVSKTVLGGLSISF
jgi:TonB-linked SusC/RagA family outer membrane protein